jgi:hypothetical protein
VTFTINSNPLAPDTAEEMVSDTILTFSPTAAVQVNKLAILPVVWDNVDTDNAEDTDKLTVTDTQSNAWLRAGEAQYSAGGVLDGVLAGIFYSVITTQIETTDTITISSTGDGTAKGCTLATFNRDTTKVVGVVGRGYERIAGSAAYSASVSGLVSEEHLWIGLNAMEAAADDTNAQDSSFSAILQGANQHFGPTGGGDTNVGARAAFKIATDTGETYDQSINVSTQDRATLLVAFNEEYPLDQSTATRRVIVA